MTQISITLNAGVWSNPNNPAVSKAVARAVKKAGGDAARSMRTESGRAIREKKRFKLKQIRDVTSLEFPKGNDITDLVWVMPVQSQTVPVSEMGARQTKKGVTFGINKGKRSLIKGGFFATMKSGHTGVFFRQGKSRLPIDEAFTTRVIDSFRDRGFIPHLYAATNVVFQSSFKRLFPLEIEKINKAAAARDFK